MDAVEKLILAIGALRVAEISLPANRLDDAMKDIGLALDEAVEQALRDAEADAK